MSRKTNKAFLFFNPEIFAKHNIKVTLGYRRSISLLSDEHNPDAFSALKNKFDSIKRKHIKICPERLTDILPLKISVTLSCFTEIHIYFGF